MVKLLIATVIVGVAIWLYLRSQGIVGTPADTVAAKSKADADAIANTPDGGQVTTSDGTTWVKYGGILFNTASPTDAAAAQSRLDAINRANKLEQIAASQGMTVDQTYQAHLSQSLADQQKETAVIMAVGAQAAQSAPQPSTPSPPLGSQPQASVDPLAYTKVNMGPTSTIAPTTPTFNGEGQDPAYLKAILNAGPKTPPPSPGMTWNYTTQSWGYAL